MLKVKDTLRSTVHLTFDGRVVKAYHGPDARTRFDHEVRVLQLLAERGAPLSPSSSKPIPANSASSPPIVVPASNGSTMRV